MANLKPAKPGQVLNPSGRPKDILTQRLRARLDDAEADALVNALLSQGKGGNVKALAMAWDRLEGKVAQPLDVKESGTKKVIVEHVNNWREVE